MLYILGSKYNHYVSDLVVLKCQVWNYPKWIFRKFPVWIGIPGNCYYVNIFFLYIFLYAIGPSSTWLNGTSYCRLSKAVLYGSLWGWSYLFAPTSYSFFLLYFWGNILIFFFLFYHYLLSPIYIGVLVCFLYERINKCPILLYHFDWRTWDEQLPSSLVVEVPRLLIHIMVQLIKVSIV